MRRSSARSVMDSAGTTCTRNPAQAFEKVAAVLPHVIVLTVDAFTLLRVGDGRVLEGLASA